MSETLVLKAQHRQATGTRAARAVRKEGKVPVTVYGHKAQPLSICLNQHDLSLELHHQHRLLDVDIDGKVEKLLVKAVQYDHFGDQVARHDPDRDRVPARIHGQSRRSGQGRGRYRAFPWTAAGPFVPPLYRLAVGVSSPCANSPWDMPGSRPPAYPWPDG